VAFFAMAGSAIDPQATPILAAGKRPG